jgi:hypothetical protein
VIVCCCCLQADGRAASNTTQGDQQAVKRCSCYSLRMDRPAGTSAAAAGTAPGLAIALVPQLVRLQMPVMFGAEGAEPALAAGAMQQVLQQEQQWQAVRQQLRQPICAGCVRSGTIWGQLVA